MKRTLTIFVILSVFFFCFSGICVNAQEYFSHASYLEEHVDWIQGDTSFSENSTEDGTTIPSHYPRNIAGSCGYVALSLLLSFYDAYWRDGFVPERYDTFGFIDDVTGEIWREMHFAIENTAWKEFWDEYWEYYKEINNLDEEAEETKAIKETVRLDVYKQFAIDHSNDYFHFYLMSLGRALGYYDGVDYGINGPHMTELLDHYLDTICNINFNQVQVGYMHEGTFTSREILYAKAREKVRQGFPVLYAGYNYSDDNSRANSSTKKTEKASHYLLAYKMTPDENDIVLTPCWNGEKLQTFNTTEYQYNSYIIWLEPTALFNHECSVSYKYSSTSDQEYCVCDIFSEHPNHVHSYDATAYDETKHWKKCLCGERREQEYHQLVFKHDYVKQHYYECANEECEYYVVKDHRLVYTATSGDLHRITCADCDYTTLDFHDFLPAANPRYSRCHYCGYTRDEWVSGGSAVIMGKKEDEETE